MIQAYNVINSKLILTNFDKPRVCKKFVHFLFNKIIWFCIAVVILFLTLLIFYSALREQESLLNAISLGAVFATLSSTGISISSLICSNSYEEFSTCLNTLRNELTEQNINIKWIFLKRNTTIHLDNKKFITYAVYNPRIEFEIGIYKLTVEIPTQKRDFRELKFLWNIVKMKLCKKNYITYLSKLSDTIIESGLLVWECIYHILYCAFIYKVHRNLMKIYFLLFICGILITFLYPIIS